MNIFYKSDLDLQAVNSNKTYKNRDVYLGLLISAVLITTHTVAYAEPIGGVITFGDGTINQDAGVTTITQTSPTLNIIWNSFNLGSSESVNFIQPSTTASAVNRILDSNGFNFLGAINANGQISFITPNSSTGGSIVTNNQGGSLNTNSGGSIGVGGNVGVGNLNGSNSSGNNTNSSNGVTGSQGGSVSINTGGGIGTTGANGTQTGIGINTNIGSGQIPQFGGVIQASGLFSLQSMSDVNGAVNNNLNMMMYGAHSRPLSRMVAEGEKTAWVAGDIGRDDHGSRSGNTGMAEISGGYNFGPAQVNVSLGQTWANQNLAFRGDLNADGQYVMVESIFPISKARNIYGVVSGFGHWGESDIRRGYINSGALASSKANVDSDTYGVRARVEWLDAKTVADIAVSPYVDVSYVKSHMDGYTEKSGPVLATFSSRSDDNTTFRLGFNASRPIAGTQFNLVANAEVAHATSDETGATTGQLAGTAFRVDGAKVHRDWVKAGIGAEGMIGKGKGLLMLNGTSNSGLPNVWLAASYQMNF